MYDFLGPRWFLITQCVNYQGIKTQPGGGVRAHGNPGTCTSCLQPETKSPGFYSGTTRADKPAARCLEMGAPLESFACV